MRKLLLIVFLLLACPLVGQALATGGHYNEEGYWVADEGEEYCANKGGVVDVRDGTTGIRSKPDGMGGVIDYWFHERIYTCGNGQEITVEIDLGPVSNWQPDAPPPPPEDVCQEGYYDDQGWNEPTC